MNLQTAFFALSALAFPLYSAAQETPPIGGGGLMALAPPATCWLAGFQSVTVMVDGRER